MNIKKILIANRGEIAIRISRACSELNIQTAAIYTYEDRYSLHRYKADEAYQIGEDNNPLKPYLDIQAIVAMAKYCRADAIHPGYGFLAENAELQKKLNVQTAEIPKLEQLLGELKTQVATIVGIENGSSNDYFNQQLSIQHKDVLHLNKELELQQKRLEADKLNNVNYDVKSLSSQDILRDKVNEIEKKFAELKYNLMNSLSTDS